MTLCPNRCGRPSRYTPPHPGKPPLCVECEALARRARDAKWAAYRRQSRAQRREGPDLSAAEIEARFRAAKAAIRQRRETSR